MNLRVLITGTSVVVCVAALAGVLVQGSQLRSLRAQQRNSLIRPDATSLDTTISGSAARPTEPSATVSHSLELLRLRNEVTRLTGRKRELVGVQGENRQ